MKKYKRDLDWHKIMQGPPMDQEDNMRENHYKGD